MTTEMDWSHDFCLSCDRQISEGAYCSQACRLADIEKASTEPTSPLNYSNSTSSSYGSPASNAAHGFHLPPAINFTSYYKSSSRIDSPPTSPHTCYQTQASYFSQTTSSTTHTSYNPPSTRSLTPSSSRSSLSSISSLQTTQGLSPQAAYELKGYVSSFDQVRESKRRLTR